MSDHAKNRFVPHEVTNGSVLRCAGRPREPHTLLIRIEEIGDSVLVVATDLDTEERILLTTSKSIGDRYFLMYRGEAFEYVERVS
jgi:hypothetical protein